MIVKLPEACKCVRMKPRQTLVINHEAEVGRGLPEGWTAVISPAQELGPAK